MIRLIKTDRSCQGVQNKHQPSRDCVPSSLADIFVSRLLLSAALTASVDVESVFRSYNYKRNKKYKIISFEDEPAALTE